MGYVLSHFPIRGRAEQVRLLLHALDLPFEHRAVDAAALASLRAEGPGVLYFGQLPLLEDGDFRLVQGPAIMSYLALVHGLDRGDVQVRARADAIVLGAEDLRTRYFQLLDPDAHDARQSFLLDEWPNRWLRSFDGLLEQNRDSGFFAGNGLTHADVAVWDVLDAVLTHVPGVDLGDRPRLRAFCDRIASVPGIADHIDQERLPSARAALYG